jgi:hypothetical protein
MRDMGCLNAILAAFFSIDKGFYVAARYNPAPPMEGIRSHRNL